MISELDSFNIESIPRFQNQEADFLENVASRLIPAENFSPNAFSIELLFRPSIPDNITNWQVFNDDSHIISFLTGEYAFKESAIDEITHDEDLHNFSVIHLPRPIDKSFEHVNSIPMSVLRLEKFYDLHDKFKGVPNCKTNRSNMRYETINLGTESNLQNINLGSDCTPNEKLAFLKLLSEFKDVFAWSYNDLKTFDTQIIQHVIPMKPQSKPFQQKLRKMHPTLEPVVKKELNKLVTTRIIFLVCHTQWVANLDPVRKKNGDIRPCVYFRNLNRSSRKDNHPLPPMEQILQKVLGAQMLSLLDGFSGYNQVLVSPTD